jgi:hypothetical protein
MWVSICHCKPCEVGAWLYQDGQPSTQSSTMTDIQIKCEIFIWKVFLISLYY